MTDRIITDCRARKGKLALLTWGIDHLSLDLNLDVAQTVPAVYHVSIIMALYLMNLRLDQAWPYHNTEAHRSCKELA